MSERRQRIALRLGRLNAAKSRWKPSAVEQACQNRNIAGANSPFKSLIHNASGFDGGHERPHGQMAGVTNDAPGLYCRVFSINLSP